MKYILNVVSQRSMSNVRAFFLFFVDRLGVTVVFAYDKHSPLSKYLSYLNMRKEKCRPCKPSAN